MFTLGPCTAQRGTHAPQLGMARELERGERILVEWPRDVRDTQIWKRPGEATTDAVARAREKARRAAAE